MQLFKKTQGILCTADKLSPGLIKQKNNNNNTDQDSRYSVFPFDYV